MTNDERHDYNDGLSNDTSDVQIAESSKTIKSVVKSRSPAVIFIKIVVH